MMKETKRVFLLHAFYDRTGIREYLEAQARKGWLLDRISSFGWILRRIEPRELHYEVTYFPKASAFDPEPLEQQLAFQDFCEHTGWQLAAANGQLQIFYNERQDPTPIETDAVLELETIHKAVKKGYLPSILLLMAVSIMNAGLFFYRLSLDPIGIFSSTTNLFTGLCWFLSLLLSSVDVLHYFRWYRRARRAAQTDGSFVETKSLWGFQIVILVIMIIGLVGLLLSLGGNRQWILYVVTLGILLFGMVLCVGFSNWMKRRKVSAKWNRALTLGFSVLAGFGICGVMLIYVLSGIRHGWLDREPTEGYLYNDQIYLAHQEDPHQSELPLTVETLMGRSERDMEKYTYQWFVEESLLMGEFQGYQHSRRDHLGEPGMEYTMLWFRWPLLYDVCLKHLMQPRHSYSVDIYGNIIYDEYKAVEAAPWGAQEVYRLYHGDYAKDQYLIGYEDQIIEIEVDWELTEEQMTMITEKLKK